MPPLRQAPEHPASAARPLDEAALRAWPLPEPPADSDKEARGRVLVVGGSHEMPGAVILAGVAALRAGAGKLQIATGASVAQLVAQAVPESRVLRLPETADGGLDAAGIDSIAENARRADAVLIGPGMLDEDASCELVARILSRIEDGTVVLDAAAMGVVRGAFPTPFTLPVVMTPHAGEMSHLTGIDRDEIRADAPAAALEAARRWNAVVALKGAVTHLADPQGGLWRHDGGSVGLGTSGSGDVLAGIVTGLAARGASAAQACAWGVVLHGRAGVRAAGLAGGSLGYLAGELAVHVPGLMHAIAGKPPIAD